MTIDVKSCGCRYRKLADGFDKCEYLCPDHKDELILKLYNSYRKGYDWNLALG